LRVIDVATPENPIEVNFLETLPRSQRVAISGNFAYVADLQAGLQILDITDPVNPVEMGLVPTISGSLRDVSVSGSVAYVVDGPFFRVVDVSDPSAPLVLGDHFTGDYSTDVSLAEGLAYVAAGSAGLQIIDVTTASSPTEIGRYHTGGISYDVAWSSGYAMVADGVWRLSVLDASTPENPTLAGTLDPLEYPYLGGEYDAGVAIDGGFAFVTEPNANTLLVVDVSTPSSPVVVATYDDPDWTPIGVAVAGGYAYIAGLGSGLRVIDVSDPYSPTEVGGLSVGGCYDVVADPPFAYLMCGPYSWQMYFVVIDVSAPEAPVLEGFVELPGGAGGVAISGHYGFVANGSQGLRVLDLSTPDSPTEIGFLASPGYANDVSVSGDLAYVVTSDGVFAVDVGTPSAPVEVDFQATAGWADAVAVGGGYVYVANQLAGIDIFSECSPSTCGPGTDDLDCDGVGNTTDNCPLHMNPMQADTDLDGSGDVCDPCPNDGTDSCIFSGSIAAEITVDDGGTITTPDGSLQVDIEPGDLAEDTTISITEGVIEAPIADLALSTGPGLGQRIRVYDLQPDGLTFDSPVLLTIVADVSDLNATQQSLVDLYLENPATGSMESLGASCSITEDPAGVFEASCTAEIWHFSLYGLVAPVDSDGDGTPDLFGYAEDPCPSSDLSMTVVVDSCDSGVANQLLENACTISDLILACSDNAPDHGGFVSCVAHLTNSLRTAGIITDEDKGAIQRCAARADLP
jgi:hypothetical protein